MRDPKAHAKVLALRLDAVRSEWVAATADQALRLWRLFNRLLAVMNKHEAATGWRYLQPEGGAPGKWVYAEIDTEENAS